MEDEEGPAPAVVAVVGCCKSISGGGWGTGAVCAWGLRGCEVAAMTLGTASELPTCGLPALFCPKGGLLLPLAMSSYMWVRRLKGLVSMRALSGATGGGLGVMPADGDGPKDPPWLLPAP